MWNIFNVALITANIIMGINFYIKGNYGLIPINLIAITFAAMSIYFLNKRDKLRKLNK